MSTKNSVYYRNKQAFLLDFSSAPISNDSSVILSEKIERKYGLIKHLSRFLPDFRNENKIEHSYEKLLKQRVYMLMQGYEDANDSFHLQSDPILQG